jgi:hypothetical protein
LPTWLRLSGSSIRAELVAGRSKQDHLSALARRVLRWLTDDRCVSSRCAYIDGMDSEKRIQAIVKTMGDGPDKIPLRRALRMCLQDLEALRAQGLTWGTIAMRMSKAGARHRRGQAISEHQLRTEFGRLTKEHNEHALTASNARKYQPLTQQNSVDSTRVQPLRRMQSTAISGSGRLSEILRTRVHRIDLDD